MNFLQKIKGIFNPKSEFKPNFLLSELNHIMVQTVDIDNLLKNVLLEIVKGAQLTKGAIFIFHNNAIYKKRLIDFTSDEPYTTDELFELTKPRRILVTQEESDLVKNLLSKQNIGLAFPIYVRETMHGIVLLGEKLNCKLFTEEDIQFFQMFVPNFAVCIENAKAYQEIKEFNKTLKSQVEKATTELTSANEHLKQIDKMKDEFVALTSHELRTPITAIDGFVYMIRKGKYGPVNQGLNQPLSFIALSADRLTLIVDNLLNITRIEAGKLEFTEEELDLVQFINEIIESLKLSASEKKLTLEHGNIANVKVFADSGKLKQVFDNVIGNSIKFTKSGSITVSTKVVGQQAIIFVTDTGIGIGIEDRENLFGKFEQINTKQEGKPSGTGLGLYFSKELMQKMGGDVWLENSTQGNGSTFAFSVPIAGSDTALRTKIVLEKEHIHQRETVDETKKYSYTEVK